MFLSLKINHLFMLHLDSDTWRIVRASDLIRYISSVFNIRINSNQKDMYLVIRNFNIENTGKEPLFFTNLHDAVYYVYCMSDSILSQYMSEFDSDSISDRLDYLYERSCFYSLSKNKK